MKFVQYSHLLRLFTFKIFPDDSIVPSLFFIEILENRKSSLRDYTSDCHNSYFSIAYMEKLLLLTWGLDRCRIVMVSGFS